MVTWPKPTIPLDTSNLLRRLRPIAPRSPLSAARDVGGDGEPASIAARPDVGVAPEYRPPIRQGVAGSRVDNREVPHQAHIDVVGFEIRDRDQARGLIEEGAPIDQAAVGIAAQEVLG